jgi:hypothetical protein
MPLLFIDSCGDHYDTAHILSKWDANAPGGGSPSVVNTGRTGNGISILSGGQTPGLVRNLTVAPGGLVAGVAFYLDHLPAYNTPVFGFGDSGVFQTLLCVDSAGALYITGSGNSGTLFDNPADLRYKIAGAMSPGGGVITNNQWYYAEMKTVFSTSTSGSVVVRIGNLEIFSTTGIKTSFTANNSANQFFVFGGNAAASGVTTTYDDIYVASTSGGGVTDFVGDCKVGCLFPSLDYAVSMTPSTGTSHYVLVNEVSPPDGDTSYNSSFTPTNFDLYELQDLPTTVVTVRGVQSCMYARKDDGSARSAAPIFSNGTTSTNGTTISLPESYGYRLQTFDSSPVDASGLTVTKVNALKGGLYVVS